MKIELNQTVAWKILDDIEASGGYDEPTEFTLVETDYGVLILEEQGLPIVAHQRDGHGFHYHYALVEDLTSDLGLLSERAIWISAAGSENRTTVRSTDPDEEE